MKFWKKKFDSKGDFYCVKDNICISMVMLIPMPIVMPMPIYQCQDFQKTYLIYFYNAGLVLQLLKHIKRGISWKYYAKHFKLKNSEIVTLMFPAFLILKTIDPRKNSKKCQPFKLVTSIVTPLFNFSSDWWEFNSCETRIYKWKKCH